MKIGKTFWWILALLALTTAAALQPGLDENKIYLRLMITWGAIILIGFVWTAFSLVGMQVQRRSRLARMQVGQTFIERFEIINQSFLPKSWIKVQDESELPDTEASRMITSLKARESRSFNIYNTLRYRGIFRLGPTVISSGDMLGLFNISRKIKSEDRVLVLPYFVDIDNFPAPYGVLPGGRALRLKTTEVTPYSAGVREYMPGDPLRRIHWPTSARKQKLIVKEFEKDPLEEVWIFLDVRKTLNFVLADDVILDRSDFLPWASKRRKFSLPPSTTEYAISSAASIARFYLNRKREVGLSVNGENHLVVASDRGERQLSKILDNLALIQAEGEIPLLALVNTHLSTLAKSSTTVLITASVEPEISDVVNILLRRGVKPVVVLIDQESFGGSPGTRKLQMSLEAQGVSAIRITCGDELANALQKAGNVGFQKYYSNPERVGL